MNMTNYLETALTNHVLGIADFTMPTPVYLALFTDNPTEAGDQSDEVPDTLGYARVSITGVMSTSVGGSTSTNSGGTIDFGPASSPWGDITHIGIMDDPTIGAGNMLMYGALDVSKTVNTGDQLIFALNQLVVGMD